ncbi:MAG TPA: MoaD/ThiS family protein [Verrucomicrobiae bacterium]|jgi:molybdopterin converting factor small subunit|nr:MoaD/ThiS family protein [Verrucomicrobiae bacterium]
MTVQVHFYSYFKELTGTAQAVQQLPDGATLGELHRQLMLRFPKLEPMRKSTLIAVGVEYQGLDHILQEADEVSLFPPVQGG